MPKRKDRPGPVPRRSSSAAKQARARGASTGDDGKAHTERDEFYSYAVDRRLRREIARLGGPSQIGRNENLPRTTINDWLSHRTRSFPTMFALWKLTRESGVSIDWLCGYAVPRLRAKRDAGGGLRRRLIHVLAERWGVSTAIVARVVPSADELLVRLAGALDWDVLLESDPKRRVTKRALDRYVKSLAMRRPRET